MAEDLAEGEIAVAVVVKVCPPALQAAATITRGSPRLEPRGMLTTAAVPVANVTTKGGGSDGKRGGNVQGGKAQSTRMTHVEASLLIHPFFQEPAVQGPLSAHDPPRDKSFYIEKVTLQGDVPPGLLHRDGTQGTTYPWRVDSHGAPVLLSKAMFDAGRKCDLRYLTAIFRMRNAVNRRSDEYIPALTSASLHSRALRKAAQVNAVASHAPTSTSSAASAPAAEPAVSQAES